MDQTKAHLRREGRPAAGRTATALLGLAVVVWAWNFAVAPAYAIDWPLRKVFTPKIGSGDGQGPSKSDPQTAVVFGLQAGKGGRLEVTATKTLKPRIFLLADPARAIVDLPDTTFQMAAGRAGGQKSSGHNSGAVKSAGPIGSYRYGLLAPGRSRIVVDLDGPAKISKVTAVQIAESVHRLRIDFARSSPAEFRKAARQGVLAAAQGLTGGGSEAKSNPVAGHRDLPLIAIDPGHGGVDGGAQASSGLNEKDIVFAFAKELAGQLRKSGRYRVLMTRDTDVFVPLRQRVEIAREAQARLFISIHADSLGERWVQGATVYTVSDRASDADAARLAEKENSADERVGYIVPRAKAEVSDILFDLTRRETRAFSHVFANSLISYLKKAATMNKNPHRSGNFVVLKAVDVPSVLLELGFLSNSGDVKRLSDPAWQTRAAAKVSRAVDAFFEGQKREERASGETSSRVIANAGKGN